MKYDWILFDLDNTLVDFKEASLKSFRSLLESYGISHADELYPIYQQINFEVWKSFEQGHLSAVELRSKRFRDFFLKTDIRHIDPSEANASYLNYLISYTTLLEGASELLNLLHKRVRMGIITNGLKEVQRPRLKALNIIHYFDSITVSDEIGVAKPQAAFFDHTFGISPFISKEQTLVVGDSLRSDIQGGLNYGLSTCWYNLSKEKNETQFTPKYEIHHLSALKEIIF